MNTYDNLSLRKLIKEKIKNNNSFEISLHDFEYSMEFDCSDFQILNNSGLFEFFLRQNKIELAPNKICFAQIEKNSLEEQKADTIVDISYSQRYATNKGEFLNKPKTENKINIGAFYQSKDTGLLLATYSANYNALLEIFDLYEPMDSTKWMHEVQGLSTNQIGYYSTLALHPFFDLKARSDNFIDRFVFAIFSRILIKKLFLNVDKILIQRDIKFAYFITLPKIYKLFNDCGISCAKQSNLRMKESEYTDSLIRKFKKYWSPENHDNTPSVYISYFKHGPIDYHFRQFHILIDEKMEYLTINKN